MKEEIEIINEFDYDNLENELMFELRSKIIMGIWNILFSEIEIIDMALKFG